jgi:UDP-galactopyranose mutase
MDKKYDYLIVGAGFTGIVLAERIASIGKKVLLIDKREHIGGNCYDYYDEAGVLVHKYGPHYFRSKSEKVVNYLSKFTGWLPQKYRVKCRVGKDIFSFPINKKTIEQIFNKSFDNSQRVEEFLDSIRDKKIIFPENAEQQVISRVGLDIYNLLFKGYTQKQWGVDPKLLDPAVTARIPISFEENENYLVEDFQAMPDQGYTAMFKEMLKNKNITLRLNTNFSKLEKRIANRIIWTGKIDEYFDHKFGKLPYRSLKFIFVSYYGREFVQEVGQINYPKLEVPYTRIVEIKHVTKQKCPNTTISIEIPCEDIEPFYPIPTKEARQLYEKYSLELKNEKNIFFLGRLGQYKYLNMDQCVEEALKLFEEIKNEE